MGQGRARDLFEVALSFMSFFQIKRLGLSAGSKCGMMDDVVCGMSLLRPGARRVNTCLNRL